MSSSENSRKVEFSERPAFSILDVEFECASYSITCYVTGQRRRFTIFGTGSLGRVTTTISDGDLISVFYGLVRVPDPISYLKLDITVRRIAYFILTTVFAYFAFHYAYCAFR